MFVVNLLKQLLQYGFPPAEGVSEIKCLRRTPRIQLERFWSTKDLNLFLAFITWNSFVVPNIFFDL